MNFKLIPLREENIEQFKSDMQEAFQQGAVEAFGEMEEEILPLDHIDRSLAAAGSITYEAILDGELVGGAIVVVNEETQHNHLDFIYVKTGSHTKGIGQQIWHTIEELHPDTKVWETCTPYFEKRNIHFYVNRCGFKIVEFFNAFHPDPNDLDEYKEDQRDYFEGMFRFEKVMK